MDAATKAATALQKAQATAIYAGLGLWPKDVMAGLVAGQIAEDGIYPDAGAAFEAGAETDGSPQPVQDYSPDQPRDPQGRWTEGGGGGTAARQSESTAGESGTAETPHSLTIHPNTIPASPSEGTSQASPATVTRIAAHNEPQEKAKSLTELFNPVTPAAAHENLQNTPPLSSAQTSTTSKSDNPDAVTQIITSYATGALNLANAYLAFQRGIRSMLGQAANLILGAAAPPVGPASTPGDGSSPQDVKRGFAGPKSMRKWQNQMTERGWTAQQIEDTIKFGEKQTAQNRINPGNGASRYVNRGTGRYVVIDDTTGEVIQISGDEFKND